MDTAMIENDGKKEVKVRPIEPQVELTSWPTNEDGKKIHWTELFDVHPLAKLFDPLKGEDIEALTANVKKNGELREMPVFCLSDDKRSFELLDGQNRLEAAMRADIELPWCRTGRTISGRMIYDTHAVYLPEGTDVHDFVIGMNILRRHLSKEKKVEIANKILKMKGATRSKTRVFYGGVKGGSTKDEHKSALIAVVNPSGISKRTVERVLGKSENSDLAKMAKSETKISNKQKPKKPTKAETVKDNVIKPRPSKYSGQFSLDDKIAQLLSFRDQLLASASENDKKKVMQAELTHWNWNVDLNNFKQGQ